MLRLILIVCLVLGLSACSSDEYPQDTADAAVRSAAKMVQNGDAERLGDLIYADSPEMRRVLDKFGRLLGKTQVLAASISRRFPTEVEGLKAAAKKRAEEGGPGMLTRMTSGMGGGRRQGGPPFDEQAMTNLVKEVFADPFGFIEANAERVGTMPVTDDLAMLLVDDQPVLPPLGLNMKKDGDKWYLLLPTNLPGVSDALPKTPEQWSIMGSMMTVFERGVEDLTTDVDSGAIADMAQLQDKLGEKLLAPGALVMLAYGREMDVRGRVDRRVTQFNTRLRTWAESRKVKSGTAVAPKFIATVSRLAPKKLEPMVRRGERWNAEAAGDADFEATLQRWLDEAGLAVDVKGELTPERVDEAITRFEQASAKPTKSK